MRKKRTFLSERIRIDASLEEIQSIGRKFGHVMPHQWIRDLRKRLHMSQKQLAQRAKMTQPKLSEIESGKAKVTVETLRRVFQALFCEALILPLAFENIDLIVRKQAILAAKKKLRSLMGSMALEDQLPSGHYLEKKIEEVADELVRSGSIEIWDI